MVLACCIQPDKDRTSTRTNKLYLQSTRPSPSSGSLSPTSPSSFSMNMGSKSRYSNGVSSEYAEIVIVRHGETEMNASGRLQGHLDIELNEVGRGQAAVVAERLSQEPQISAIYSSDLRRAFETAQIIAKRCGCLEVKQVSELRDRHLGDIQGLVLEEAAKLKPEAYQAFVSWTRDQDIPGGGESLNQVYKRCTSALQNIAEKHAGERVVLVTHAGVIEALHERASPKGKSPGNIANTSVNVFQLYGNGDWVITNWGDVSHLDENMVLENGFGGAENSG